MAQSAQEQLRGELFRRLPSVDELLAREPLASLAREVDRALVVSAARAVLDTLRAQIAGDPAAAERRLAGRVEAEVAALVRQWLQPSLRPVINATGVVLHTNLGRAPLAAGVPARIAETATQYSNLEYDLAARARGKRDAHTAALLCRLLGAEAAIVVNNCAAAVFLALNTFAKGREVIVSRGELIEIGDGFRIPDILAESGAVLREVGATNRTRLADYERAINERTRLLLRVHPSNFRVVGFTEKPSLEELVALGARRSLPVMEDLGSGCLVDLAMLGFDEPPARASLAAGASMVSFSGDKLLGGPQCGVLAGKKDCIERMRRNPLFRALRVDKLTIAALEATLLAYLRGAVDEVPALRMIRMSNEEIERRARALAELLMKTISSEAADISVRAGESVIGGGSTPEQSLPTSLIAIAPRRISVTELDARLQSPENAVPVVARIEDERLMLDLRTVFPEQEEVLVSALRSALE
jgi:L-seryl-tRNA(Ser) seleniumtransferase